MSNFQEQPVHIFSNFGAGGVPTGIFQGVFLKHLEDLTDQPISNFIHSFHAASVGTTLAFLLFAKDPETRLPRFTAEDSLEIYKETVRKWLPYNFNPIEQCKQKALHSLRSRLRSKWSRAAIPEFSYFHDERTVEETITQYLSDTTLGDIMIPAFVSAHNFSALDSGNSAVLFSNLDLHDPEQNVDLHRSLPLKRIIRASTAVPGVFRGVTIPGLGHFGDMNHIHSEELALTELRRTFPGSSFGFVDFGTPRYSNFLTSQEYNRTTLLGMIRNSIFTDGTGNHSRSVSLKTIKASPEVSHVFDLTTTYNMQSYASRRDLPFSKNIMDASEGNIQCIEAAAWEQVEARRAEFETLAAFLINNQRLINTVQAAEEVDQKNVIALPVAQPQPQLIREVA